MSHLPKTLASLGIWIKLQRLKEKQLFQARQGIFRGAVVLHHQTEVPISVAESRSGAWQYTQ